MLLVPANIALSSEDIRNAIAEANRCLGCKAPKCQQGCPIANDIPEFIAAMAAGDFGEARRVISRKSNLPAICGRVCAHEKQCEGNCVLNKAGKPVRIGMLERVVADFAFEMRLPFTKIPPKPRGNVAVIGSGPAGLTVAGDLAKEGFAVTVYEAQEEAGGILLYGIPSFRLSKKIVRREIENIKMLGVEFKTGMVVGRDITVDDMLEKGADAVFIGTGTALARELDLPGKSLDGIIQSSYLLRMNYLLRSGQLARHEVPVQEGDRVLIVGAGNVGMDAARTAVRLGAASVNVVYRRGEAEIPALQSEYQAAVAEGVGFRWFTSPLEYRGENGALEALHVQTPEGAADIPCDKVFLAVGSRPASRIVSTTEGIEVNEGGYVTVKERPYGMTTKRGVFAGGDVVHQPATVVLAMKEAKKVVHGIAQYIDAVHLLELT